MLQQSTSTNYGKRFPANFVGATKFLLMDDEENVYIDGIMGCGALNFGHNPKVLVDELVRHCTSNPLVGAMDLNTPEKERFENVLGQVLGLPGERTIQYPGPTGTNAVEAAIKMARQYVGMTKIGYLEGSFHGCTLGSLQLTDCPTAYSPDSPEDDNVSMTHPFDDDGIDVLDKINSGELGAIIIEVVQGRTLKVIDDIILRSIEAACLETHTLLIVDEIQTGVFRTGNFLSTPKGFDPDIVVLSKSLTGMGLPLSVVVARKCIDKCSYRGQHSGTFRGNGLAVQLAYTNIISHYKDAPAKCYLLEGLFKKYLDVVGKGMMLGIRTKDSEVLTTKLYEELRLLTEPITDNLVKIMFPLTLSPSGVKPLCKQINVVMDKYELSL